MSRVKKINEENLVMIQKKVKKVPMKRKPLWELGLTKKQLIAALKDVPDDAVLVTPSFDHAYDLVDVKIGTALFETYGINEDFGDDLTPEGEYGTRKQVIIIS